jgi:hypothetical protein
MRREMAAIEKKRKKWSKIFKLCIWWLVLLLISGIAILLGVTVFMHVSKSPVLVLALILLMVMVFISPVMLPLFIVSIVKKRNFKKILDTISITD